MEFFANFLLINQKINNFSAVNLLFDFFILNYTVMFNYQHLR